MNFQAFSTHFKEILSIPVEEHQLPYDNPAYLDYTRLNWSRMNRWFKTGKLSNEIVEAVKKKINRNTGLLLQNPGVAMRLTTFHSLK